MEGETGLVSPTVIDRKNDSSPPYRSHHSPQHSRVASTHVRPNTNVTNSVRGNSGGDRHTLPEIPRNPVTATVAHVVSKELG